MDSRVQCAKEKLQARLPDGFEIMGFSYEPELFGNMSALIKMGRWYAIEFGVDRGLVEGYVRWPRGKEVTIESLMRQLKIPMNKELLKIGIEGYSLDAFLQCLNDNMEAIQRMGQE